MPRTPHAPTVAVVGAGLAGLAAACRLARAGCDVTVFEQQPFTGGKAASESFDGFRFDTGPSLVTMPEVFDDLFASCGERREDHIRFIPLSPICRYRFADGTVLDAFHLLDRFAAEVASKTRDTGHALRRFLAYTRRIRRVAAPLFLHRSLHEPSTYLSPRTWLSLLLLPAIDPLRTMDTAVRSFFRDPRMVQLFNRYATYNGSNPYRTPATLNIIPSVEYDGGGFAAEGGIQTIPAAITALARRQGVTFHLATPVSRILHDRNRVLGVRTPQGDHPADFVISNADVLSTYEDLLQDPQAPQARRYRRLEPSSSGLVFLWGVERTFPQLSTNNILFSPDYAAEFSDLFDRLSCPRDPTVYINITSKTTPADAPPGCENWFVLVNAPADHGQDWDTEVRRTRTAVLRRISSALRCDIEPLIRTERVITPPDIARRTGSRHGSLYGISSNTTFSAFLRHPNRSRRYDGLFLCGGSCHPGGGMPLALLSGAITADLVLRHLRNTP